MENIKETVLRHKLIEMMQQTETKIRKRKKCPKKFCFDCAISIRDCWTEKQVSIMDKKICDLILGEKNE